MPLCANHPGIRFPPTRFDTPPRHSSGFRQQPNHRASNVRELASNRRNFVPALPNISSAKDTSEIRPKLGVETKPKDPGEHCDVVAFGVVVRGDSCTRIRHAWRISAYNGARVEHTATTDLSHTQEHIRVGSNLGACVIISESADVPNHG